MVSDKAVLTSIRTQQENFKWDFNYTAKKIMCNDSKQSTLCRSWLKNNDGKSHFFLS